MSDRGRFNRDEKTAFIPVAELLASHKRARYTGSEEPVLFDELLGDERLADESTPAQPARSERPERPERPARPGKPARAERQGRLARQERQVHQEREAKLERQARAERQAGQARRAKAGRKAERAAAAPQPPAASRRPGAKGQDVDDRLFPMPPSPKRHMPRVLGVAATITVLVGALAVAQHLTSHGTAPFGQGADASGPEHITGYKVFKPDIIRASVEKQPEAASDAGAQQPEAADTLQDAQAGQAGQPGQAPGAAAGAQPAGGTAGTVGGIGGDAPRAAQPQPQPGQGQVTAPRPGAPVTTTAAAPPRNPVSPAPQQPAATTTTTASRGGLLDPILQPLDPITGPILGPILGFYSTAPSDPSSAYVLLDTAVQGGTVDDFAKSWSGIRGAVVEGARQDGPNAMVVRVLMQRVDGTLMRTEQRIVVSTGSVKPKIVDAQLLSASLG